MKNRACNHISDLKHGRHHNCHMRAAYDIHKAASWEIIERVSSRYQETPVSLKARLYEAEQRHISEHHGKPYCLNISRTAIGATYHHPEIAERWRQPEYRERMMALRLQRNYRPSEATKEKMAAAKRGERNPNARPVVLVFKGEEFRFPCASHAARHFGVTQQIMDFWLKGKCSWPGTGRRTRKVNQRLIGLVGSFADLVKGV